MCQYLYLECKRAFCNVYFFISIMVAFGICIWHFIENIWGLRFFICDGIYPLSAFSKWIGGDNASIQPTLYFLIIPILCAIPYAKSFYFDVKSGFIIQLITRGEKKDYVAAKFITSFMSGAVIAVIPLIVDFIMTNTILPAVVPQRGTGLFTIVEPMIWSDLFYTHPFMYLFLFGIMQAVFFGLFNTIAIWAVNFINNGFWIVLMPFLSYMFIFCMFQFVNMERFVPMFFLRPSQPFRSDIYVVILELFILIVLNLFFFIWYTKKEQINYE